MASHEQTRIKRWCWRSTTTRSNFIDRKKIHIKYTHTNYIEQRLFEAGSVGTLQTVTFYFMWQKPGLWQAFGVLWYIYVWMLPCHSFTFSPNTYLIVFCISINKNKIIEDVKPTHTSGTSSFFFDLFLIPRLY